MNGKYFSNHLDLDWVFLATLDGSLCFLETGDQGQETITPLYTTRLSFHQGHAIFLTPNHYTIVGFVNDDDVSICRSKVIVMLLSNY